MNRYKFKIAGLLLGLGAMLAGSPASADIRARLDGYQENPSVSTHATGSFRAKFRHRSDAIEYKLSYSNIESFVRFSHIHLARRHVNGGVLVWLCDNTGNAPIAVPPCPQGAGSVEGVITAAEVTGTASQGLAAGEFGELLDAIGRRATYINVHSDSFPGGEIRGQIRGNPRGGDDDDDD